ncbi:hypothetical protein AXF42_Ash018767 [Apostasia shenzhenica]|uniref:Uncharacterized protein n=1 Tax=Apostasia shenzhenica TaxID=1088818 RepID=A0A2I0AJY7_9ASPA|nr:hypothetical protein AXF42_Ash018767 [Apostasia shenzhenica]
MRSAAPVHHNARARFAEPEGGRVHFSRACFAELEGGHAYYAEPDSGYFLLDHSCSAHDRPALDLRGSSC